MSATRCQRVRQLAREIREYSSDPGVCARVLADMLRDEMDAYFVAVARRSRLGGRHHDWLPSAWVGESVAYRAQLAELESHPDFVLPVTDALMLRREVESFYVVSRETVPPLPPASLRIHRAYREVADAGDAIAFKSDLLGEPGYCGMLTVGRRRTERSFSDDEIQFVTGLMRAVGSWFWPGQRRHLRAMASVQA